MTEVSSPESTHGQAAMGAKAMKVDAPRVMSEGPSKLTGAGSLSLSIDGTGRSRVMAVVFLLVCISLSWISLGDHPIYDRSEGRYASVSRHMEESGDWLVPVFKGQPHLTKPPLTYWLQAGAMRVMGINELAVRLPTAVAGSLTLVLVMLLARRMRGLRYAVVVTALLSVMPLQVMLSRIALTDGVLGFFWFGVLASALLAVREPEHRGRWVTLMWAAMAGAFITKGPPAILPLVVVAAWLVLAGRWRDLRWMKIWLGLPLSLVPLALWVGVTLRTHPEALQIWHREIVDRATGSGDHVEPMWFFLPIFIVGLFPATAMFSLPGLHYPLSRVRELAKNAAPEMLWTLAMVIPFVVFSINTGKLATYLLPLCPPLAMLVGRVVEAWLTGEFDRPREGRRHVPDFSKPLMVIGLIAAVASPVVMGLLVGWHVAWMAVGVLPVTAACVWMAWVWHRRPAMRGMALLAVWLATCGVWIGGFEAEDMIRDTEGVPTVVERAVEVSGVPAPTIVMFRYFDASMAFYYRGPIADFRRLDELLPYTATHPHAVVLVTLEDWKRTLARTPSAAVWFREVSRYGRIGTDNKTYLMLIRVAAAQAPVTGG